MIRNKLASYHSISLGRFIIPIVISISRWNGVIDIIASVFKFKGVRHVKRISIGISDASATGRTQDIIRLQEVKFMINSAKGQVLCFCKVSVNNESVLLFFIDVGKAIRQFESSLKSELCCQSKRFISPPHIKLVQP